MGFLSGFRSFIDLDQAAVSCNTQKTLIVALNFKDQSGWEMLGEEKMEDSYIN